jgi:hypothetical protein
MGWRAVTAAERHIVAAFFREIRKLSDIIF